MKSIKNTQKNTNHPTTTSKQQEIEPPGVSYFLLRFFDKIPTKHPILKSVFLSFAAIVIIEVLSTFGNLSNAYVYLIIDTVMNVPRILALGIVIGYLYKKL